MNAPWQVGTQQPAGLARAKPIVDVVPEGLDFQANRRGAPVNAALSRLRLVEAWPRNDGLGWVSAFTTPRHLVQPDRELTRLQIRLRTPLCRSEPPILPLPLSYVSVDAILVVARFRSPLQAKRRSIQVAQPRVSADRVVQTSRPQPIESRPYAPHCLPNTCQAGLKLSQRYAQLVVSSQQLSSRLPVSQRSRGFLTCDTLMFRTSTAIILSHRRTGRSSCQAM